MSARATEFTFQITTIYKNSFLLNFVLPGVGPTIYPAPLE